MTQPAAEPAQPPLPTPKLTASTAPMDVHEWRARWESRANMVTLVGVVLFLQAGITRTPVIAWGALILAPILIGVSIWLRPRLPWHAPTAVRGSATGTDHEGHSTTGPFPVPGLQHGTPGPARPVTAPLPLPPRYVPTRGEHAPSAGQAAALGQQ